MITTPSVEYGVLSPMLIVFAVAIVGVLVEAFLPRRSRYPVQVVLGVSGLVLAFIALVGVYRGIGTGQQAVMGSVTIDRPALFLQGAILAVAVIGVLLIAERRTGGSASSGLHAFTPQASAVPGSVAEQVATKAAVMQT